MFQIKINKEEKVYAVFGERELNIITNPTSFIVTCPNYYELNIIPASTPIIKYTNIEPIIIEDDPFTESGFNKINISFGQPITIEEYEILHELYLMQMEENPAPEYLKAMEIKEAVKQAKHLVKKTKRA